MTKQAAFAKVGAELCFSVLCYAMCSWPPEHRMMQTVTPFPALHSNTEQQCGLLFCSGKVQAELS